MSTPILNNNPSFQTLFHRPPYNSFFRVFGFACWPHLFAHLTNINLIFIFKYVFLLVIVQIIRPILVFISPLYTYIFLVMSILMNSFFPLHRAHHLAHFPFHLLQLLHLSIFNLIISWAHLFPPFLTFGPTLIHLLTRYLILF